MNWQQTRDRILLAFGLFGIFVLTVVWVVTRRPPDPELLIAFGGLTGLPAFLKRDERNGG